MVSLSGAKGDMDNQLPEEYDSKAAGGLRGGSTRRKPCKEHSYAEKGTCPTCVQNKNHGETPEKRSSRRRFTKSTPWKGAAYKESWYDRQATTLERLRREGYGEETQYVDR